MNTNDWPAPDPSESPAGAAGGTPTPRLTEPATEETEVSVERERDAAGDAPDTGGLTPPEQAQ